MQLDVTMNYYQGCKGILEGTEDEKRAQLFAMEKTGLWVASSKIDGEWAAVHGGQPLTVMSRNDLPHQSHGLPSFPKGTLVVGELAEGSQSAVKLRQKMGHPFIDCFDILFFNNVCWADKPLLDRLNMLKTWHSKLWDSAKPFYRLLPVWTKDFVNHYDSEEEGLVLKRIDGGSYIPGTKVSHWIKVKKEMTVDGVVMDWVQSTAATKSSVPMVKNVIVGQYVNGVLQEIARPGNIPHGLSMDMAANFGNYRGKVMEIKAYARFDSGKLRHPAYLRMRTDKTPAECVWDKQ